MARDLRRPQRAATAGRLKRMAQNTVWISNIGPSSLRPVLAMALLLVCCDAARGGDQPFTVANYPVEARADNAVAAKERALLEGQQAALRSLLKRLVPVSAYPSVRHMPALRAADLVDAVRVRSERNSSTEYIASLDFSFQPKAIRDLLRREGIAFVDDQAPTLTVIPLWRTAAAAPAQNDANWTKVWKGLDLEHALTPVKLATLLASVKPEAVASLASGDGSALRVFSSGYGSELVLLALAEPDAASKRLRVSLSGRDAVGAFTLQSTYRLDPSDPGYASELAAVVSLGILEGRWKAIRAQGGEAAPASGDSNLLIAVEFRGMSEWQDISRKLAATPGVEELEVAGLSARGARVTLRYADGALRLAEALANQGLTLRSAGGSWTLAAQ
jgi:hypothetical protein